MVEYDFAVSDFLHAISRRLQAGDLSDDFHHPGAGHGHDDLDEYHGEHHQRHEQCHDVGEQRHQGANLHGTVHNLLSSHPADKENRGIHRQHHHRLVENQYLFCPFVDFVDILTGFVKVSRLESFPDKGLHHPDARCVFLHEFIQLVVFFEHLHENRVNELHHPENQDSQYNQNRHDPPAQTAGGGEDHEQTGQHHEGGADGYTDDHLVGHLQVVHICHHAGDQAAGGELVDVFKGEVLNVPELRIPDVFRKSAGCNGCVFS